MCYDCMFTLAVVTKWSLATEPPPTPAPPLTNLSLTLTQTHSRIPYTVPYIYNVLVKLLQLQHMHTLR